MGFKELLYKVFPSCAPLEFPTYQEEAEYWIQEALEHYPHYETFNMPYTVYHWRAIHRAAKAYSSNGEYQRAARTHMLFAEKYAVASEYIVRGLENASKVAIE